MSDGPTWCRDQEVEFFLYSEDTEIWLNDKEKYNITKLLRDEFNLIEGSKVNGYKCVPWFTNKDETKVRFRFSDIDIAMAVKLRFG